jgi:hypothetical protein
MIKMNENLFWRFIQQKLGGPSENDKLSLPNKKDFDREEV